MEVALSVRFLGSQVLFSLTSNYEKALKNELWLCHKNMDLSMNDLYQMPTGDRKAYINIHNKVVEKEKERLEKLHKKK